jgi:Zn-dependent protease
MNMTKLLDPQILLVTWPVFLFSLSLHEFMHAWLADRLGDPTARYKGRLTLNPFAHYDPIGTTFGLVFRTFGWAKPVPVNPVLFRWPQRGMMITALGGPAVNFVLAGVCLVAFKIMAAQDALDPNVTTGLMGLFKQMAAYGIVLNLSLAVFNLVPLFPLDGHHILRGFLSFHAALAYDRMKHVGIFLLIPLVIMGGGPISGLVYTLIEHVLSPTESYQLYMILIKLF